MSAAPMSIGALAGRSGCSVPTIRYYEQIGLLAPAKRTAAGHRHYRESDLLRLQFIRRCRELDFPLEQVRELISMFQDTDGDCADVRDLAQRQLAAVRARLSALHQLESGLAAAVENCDRSCIGGPKRDCCIIEDLAGASARTADIAVTELRRRP